MRDPYEVLGVAKNASAKEIKAAYRKLAKKHHPDQNPDDSKAKDRFAAASQAYEILGDEKSRGAFDRGEIDAVGSRVSRVSRASRAALRMAIPSPASAASRPAQVVGPVVVQAARASNFAQAAIRSAAMPATFSPNCSVRRARSAVAPARRHQAAMST